MQCPIYIDESQVQNWNRRAKKYSTQQQPQQQQTHSKQTPNQHTIYTFVRWIPITVHTKAHWVPFSTVMNVMNLHTCQYKLVFSTLSRSVFSYMKLYFLCRICGAIVTILKKKKMWPISKHFNGSARNSTKRVLSDNFNISPLRFSSFPLTVFVSQLFLYLLVPIHSLRLDMHALRKVQIALIYISTLQQRECLIIFCLLAEGHSTILIKRGRFALSRIIMLRCANRCFEFLLVCVSRCLYEYSVRITWN